MALEPITRQEQIIAGKDLEPITRMEKFLKEYGGGGGASSWNDLDDRPFGEETTYGDTLTWDGNTEGLENQGEQFYKVTDIAPSIEDFVNGGSATTNTGDVLPFTSAEIHELGPGVFIAGDYALIAVNYGTFLVAADGNYISSLTINGYNGFETTVVKPIDNKYLEPFETVGGDTLTWDGNTEGLNEGHADTAVFPIYRVSEATPSVEELSQGGTLQLFMGGEIMESPFTTTLPDGEGIVLSGDGSSQIPFVYIFSDGVYLAHDGSDEDLIYVTSLTINGYTGFTTTKLKEEYIPVDYIKQLIAEVTGN